MEQDFGRMIDKAHKPTEKEILSFIGEKAKEAWLEIKQFIEKHYGIEPENLFYGAKYGWTIRYRKGGKTLCSLFPEKDGFTILITLGKKEFEKALSLCDELGSKIQKLLRNTKQLHDGRWLWIQLLTKDDIDDVKKLLQIKRKPKKNKS
jgi:hypothetical protein